jgi:hypothetical protein
MAEIRAPHAHRFPRLGGHPGPGRDWLGVPSRQKKSPYQRRPQCRAPTHTPGSLAPGHRGALHPDHHDLVHAPSLQAKGPPPDSLRAAVPPGSLPLPPHRTPGSRAARATESPAGRSTGASGPKRHSGPEALSRIGGSVVHEHGPDGWPTTVPPGRWGRARRSPGRRSAGSRGCGVHLFRSQR